MTVKPPAERRSGSRGEFRIRPRHDGKVSNVVPPARQLWQLIEPYHALTYYVPESREAYEAVGLRGFWRGYFAGRAAPLGPVGPGVVIACFFGFHPAFVARALPSIWSMAEPATALQARLRGVDSAVRRVFADCLGDPAFARSAELIRQVVERNAGSDIAGRPLFAANLELDWPSEPHLTLWHAATLLREHRGDGHVAALTIAGLDPCEAHASKVAASGAGPETIQPYRGWTDEDWAAATERLRARGWLDAEGRLTADGQAGRNQVEGDTDRLAIDPTERLQPDRADELFDLLGPITARLIDSGTIPYPNPIGVPFPS
jgi:hypothetical protein